MSPLKRIHDELTLVAVRAAKAEEKAHAEVYALKEHASSLAAKQTDAVIAMAKLAQLIG
jgi:pyrimidine deaminase RibD-like protein